MLHHLRSVISLKFSSVVHHLRRISFWIMVLIKNISGPPGQVAAVAGKKDGRKQGELGGILKALGYSEGQVCSLSNITHTLLMT